MSSQSTIRRLVRCRVKDLASCFHVCRFPLEKEADTLCSTWLQMQNKSIILDSKGLGRDCKASKRMSTVKKIFNEDREKSVENSPKNTSSSSRSLDGSCASSSRFAEEDYIVFCFREDGAIQMITEGKSSNTFNENDEFAKVDEEGSNEMESGCWALNKIKEMNLVEDSNASKIDSFQFCDSNPSDTTSFAFPVFGMEWISSPVHMPKSKSHETQTVRLNYCTL